MPVPPDPTALHPMPDQPRVVLLKPLVTSPLIDVGEFSYYDDADDPTAFETRNVLYHYGPEKLIIGKFCALGEGVRFIMNGANHRMDGPSTFPFPIMGGSWAEHFGLVTGLPGQSHPTSPQRRRHRPPPRAGLVGLAAAAPHPARRHDHVRQRRGAGGSGGPRALGRATGLR
ncbi:hypothetical protein ACFYUV_44645 [Nonomuraea sp. NPDC003560]|uniref:hypothetical protein n=1 Tax=Nonomuraea sp. NPDC003560 TaxID=3364341 RepID=UPI0036CB665A